MSFSCDQKFFHLHGMIERLQNWTFLMKRIFGFAKSRWLFEKAMLEIFFKCFKWFNCYHTFYGEFSFLTISFILFICHFVLDIYLSILEICLFDTCHFILDICHFILDISHFILDICLFILDICVFILDICHFVLDIYLPILDICLFILGIQFWYLAFVFFIWQNFANLRSLQKISKLTFSKLSLTPTWIKVSWKSLKQFFHYIFHFIHKSCFIHLHSLVLRKTKWNISYGLKQKWKFLRVSSLTFL